MVPPRETSEPGRGGTIALRVIGAVLTLVAGGPWAFLVLTVLSARFGAEQGDPHGYLLIFGTVLALPVGLVAASGAGLLAPAGRRGRWLGAALLLVLVVWLALLALLVTA